MNEPLHDLLAERLAPVVARVRRARLLRGWLALGAGAALLALGLRLLEERRGWQVGLGWVALLALVLVAGWVIRRRVDQRGDGARAAARLIEQRQPELHALLLTAVAQAPRQPGGGLGYLQEQLVRQALARAEDPAWEAVVPVRRLRALGAGAAGAALVLGYCALTGLAPGVPSLFDDAYGLHVTPGNTRAERGTSVLVLARFSGRLPGRVELVVEAAGKAPVRAPMRRSMEDPVWGAVTPPLGGPARYFVEHDGGRSPDFRIQVFRAPEVERLDARVEYPSQPKVAAREVRDVRFLSVTEGARVTISAHVTEGARAVTLVPEGEGAAVRLSSTSDRLVFSGVLMPTRTHRYEVRVTDGEGRRNETPPRLSLELHRNEPAQIALTFPGKDTRVSPLEEMTVEAKISDDTAVLAYGVAYRLAGQPARELRLGEAAKALVNARAVIALEDLGAQPDQLLTYHFWAEDRDGAGKLRRTSSDMYFAEVRSFEQRFREAAGGGEQEEGGEAGEGGALADHTRRQKDIINATWRLERAARDVKDADKEGAREAAEALARDLAVVATAQEKLQKDSEGLREKAHDARTRGALELAVTAMAEAVRGLQAAGKAPGKALDPVARALDAEQRAYAALLRLRDSEQNVGRGRGRGAGGGEGQAPELAGLELKQKENRFETRQSARPQRPGGTGAEREAVGRLEELARRQKALSDRLKEAKAALEQKAGKDEEAERRLKRLREEQQELLEDLDQVRQRLERQAQAQGQGQSEQEARGAEAREGARAELERTRAEAAAVAEALARGEAGRALGASTRAERGLDRARGELSKGLAAGFGEQVRELRDAARALDEKQQALAQALAGAGKTADKTAAGKGAEDKGAAAATDARRVAEELRRQKAEATKLLDRVEAVSAETEQAAPLVSRKLYEGLREAKMSDLETALDLAGELLDRNLADDGRMVAQRAQASIGQLRSRVDEAAKGVLGDEAEALRAAQSELDGLIAQAQRESAGEGQAGQSPGAQAGQGAGAGAQPGRAGQPGSQGQRGAGARAGGGAEGAPGEPASAAGGPGGPEGPITGRDFRGFAERLRDLQDLLDDSRLRNQAADVGDRARALRADWKDKGQRPTTALLDQQVLRPLAELRVRVSEQLGRLERNDKLVPLDRDPIPSRYTDLVRRYWKSLSEGK